MSYFNINDLEMNKIVFRNLRLFRKLKEIKQETLALELGISRSEYSKLENGYKKNWNKHLEKICELLNINCFELVFEKDFSQSKNGKVTNQPTKIKAPRKEEIENKDYTISTDNNLYKDELLTKYRDDVTYWKQKYYRMKDHYLNAKLLIQNLGNEKLAKEVKKEHPSKSLNNVGKG